MKLDETFSEKLVTYTVQIDDRLIVIENVPARVSDETGERLFSPQTVERIHEIVRSNRPPTRTITAPVYEFAA
jgi:YgiT-type zinc finger domain-containing protein